MTSVRLAVVAFVSAALACSSSSSTSNPGPDASGADAGSPDAASADTASPTDSSTGGDASSHGDGPGGDTWNSYAKAFFKTYCVECHNATTPNPNQDFDLYADVKGLASTIRCGVAPAGKVQSGCPTSGFPPPGQFPITDTKGTNPKPSDAERLRIVAWINAGLPQ